MSLFIIYRSSFLGVLLLASCSLFSMSVIAQETSYRKSTEGAELVKKKLYPKKDKMEFNVDGGTLLNQSYLNTILVGAGGNYFFSEEWGLNIDITKAINSDKPERKCIENFYNNPLHEDLGDVCGDSSNIPANSKASMGPAYVPVRELDMIASANAVWNPIYGKALFFMSGVLHFDLYLEAGAGLATSTYYAKTPTLRNGNQSRGDFDPKGNPLNGHPIGAQPSETGSYGIAGRPDPQAQSNPLINLGIGQKFHFGKQFHASVYLRNITLLGTQDGFDNLFALYGGLGMRF